MSKNVDFNLELLGGEKFRSLFVEKEGTVRCSLGGVDYGMAYFDDLGDSIFKNGIDLINWVAFQVFGSKIWIQVELESRRHIYLNTWKIDPQMKQKIGQMKQTVQPIGGRPIYDLRAEKRDSPLKGATKIYKEAMDSKHHFARLATKGWEGVANVKQEAQILEELHGCPGVVRCIGTKEKKSKSGAPKFYLYLERYDGGDLKTFGLERLKKLPFEQKLTIARQLSQALADMHEIGISHNDIKFENILIRLEEGLADVAFCDFDLASTDRDPTRFGLSPTWTSPEKCAVWAGIEKKELMIQVRKSADVWALGLVLMALFEGKQPFWFDCLKEDVIPLLDKLAQMRDREGSFYSEPKNKHSPEHIIWQMLQLDHKRRLSADEALKQFEMFGP